MLKNFHPITYEAAAEVASNLLEEDKRECYEGHGFTNEIDIVISALTLPGTYYYEAPNGKSAAIGGVYEEGKIWMLCSDVIKEYPRQSARDISRFVNSRPEKLLWNVVDKRNTTHIKLLRFLGFKFLREVLHGPNLLTFIEFCKINHES